MYFRVRVLKKLRRDHFAKKSRIIKLIIKENLFCCCASRELDDVGHSDDDCEVHLRSSGNSGNHSSNSDLEEGSFIERRLRSVNRSRKNIQPRSGGTDLDWRALRQSGINLISTKSIDRENVISTDSDFSHVDNNNSGAKSQLVNNDYEVKLEDEEEHDGMDCFVDVNGINTISKIDISANAIENGDADVSNQTDLNNAGSTI